MVQSLILSGPTATGKSSLALEMAERMGLEIINSDSVCFYRRFDIGSAKPTLEERKRVPHHLVDCADPLDGYHVGRFIKECQSHLKDIHSRGKRALIVGGSGFYLKALRLGLWDAPEASPEFRQTLAERPNLSLHEELAQLDPAHASKIGASDRYRLIRALEIIHLSGHMPSALESQMKRGPDPAFPLWVVDRTPEELQGRIRERIRGMLDRGWVEETRKLLHEYPAAKALGAVGYAEVVRFLKGEVPQGRKLRPGIDGLREEIELSHRQLVKQQRTWFKQLAPEESFLLDRDETNLKEKLIRFYQ
jgi:tRNA dimethylallyltransferase